MEPETFVEKIRLHYLEQFKAFVADQKLNCTMGTSEVKIRLSEESQVYQRLYCVDFIKNDEGSKVIELQPNFLKFEPWAGAFGNAELTIEQLRWDDIIIRHNAVEALSQLPDWFEHWFDPEDARHDPDAEFSNVVHSVVLEPGELSIDMGTAVTDAFWALLDLIENAGATHLMISASTNEPE